MKKIKKISEITREELLNFPEDLDIEWEHGVSKKLPLSIIDYNSYNWNEMSSEEFNLLCDNINEVGMLDPILVVPSGRSLIDASYRFMVIDGEHRVESARLSDMEEILCIIADPNSFDEKQQMKQTARMNTIKGHPNKDKFMKFVDIMTSKHKFSIDELAYELGYADETEFQNLISNARETLPPDAKKEFDKIKDEIKTVDDLALVLNRLFTKYGDTLPYNFMIIDFGGKGHLWVRVSTKYQKKGFDSTVEKARKCILRKVTFDSFIMALLENTDIDKFIDEYIDNGLEEPNLDTDSGLIDQYLGEIDMEENVKNE